MVTSTQKCVEQYNNDDDDDDDDDDIGSNGNDSDNVDNYYNDGMQIIIN